jgi:RNA polymerase sigma factor (sigma-70 family)
MVTGELKPSRRYFSLFTFSFSLNPNLPMFQTDEELVKRCRDGDEFAWEEIVLKYQKLLMSIPRRAGLADDLAADVLQIVFTTLFLRLDSLEQPEFLKAWLITTTRHKTIDLIKRETRIKPVYIDDDESDFALQLPDKSIPADEILIRIEQEIQIEKAFGLIDERCRHLLNMLYLEDEPRSYNEIAEILSIPSGSIGPTRARCLQKLIKMLPD